MFLYTGEESKVIDKLTIEKGFPSILLMENAAYAIKNRIEKTRSKSDEILIICGKGNNGGDGLALGRILFLSNYRVKIFLLGEENELSQDSKINLRLLKKIGVEIENDKNKLDDIISKSDLIVDAIMGIGFSGQVREGLGVIIDKINNSGKDVYAVDICTGINSETGQVSNKVIKAKETITFGFAKLGHILYPGYLYSGKISIYDIGFFDEAIEKVEKKYFTLSKKEALLELPKREIRSNKGTFGRVLIIGGSRDMSGALILSCKASYKAGAGYVYGASVAETIKGLKVYLPEAITISSEKENLDISFLEKLKGVIDKVDIIAIGPGLGLDSSTEEMFFEIIRESKKPLVIDADGLNMLATNMDILKDLEVPIILTPHPGEMSRLMKVSIEEILSNPIKAARKLSIEYGVITVLKDNRTIVSNETGQVYINTTGNPSMAKAGSGDVLTGIISALIAQGLDPFKAGYLGVYFHGLAGDEARDKLGDYGVLARDIIENLFKV